MTKKKVLIVDDSSVIRKIVSDAVSSQADLEICGLASNGKIALNNIRKTNPDIIILDIEMPEMNGLETLKELNKTNPDIPVIMFSAVSEEGARVTLDALALGARDFVTKPSASSGLKVAKETVENKLIEKIRGLISSKQENNKSYIDKTYVKSNRINSSLSSDRIIAIGSSTGGPVALTKVLNTLSPDFKYPIVVTQHMPPIFTKLLAERLSRDCKINAVEATEGQEIIPGKVYIAPGDYHMTFHKQEQQILVRLNKEPPENGCRPAVDVMFRSLAEIYKENVIAVILTGMGCDGQKGAEILKAGGANIIAQNEESSVVWGMPGAVVRTGLADVIANPEEIRRILSDFVNSPDSLIKKPLRLTPRIEHEP